MSPSVLLAEKIPETPLVEHAGGPYALGAVFGNDALDWRPLSVAFSAHRPDRAFEVNEGGAPCRRYISLLKFTQKGVETIKDGPKRLDAARQSFKDAGAVAKLALTTGMMGNVRTHTMRAFGEAEYRKIVSSLP